MNYCEEKNEINFVKCLIMFSDLYMLRLEKFQNLPVNKIELLGFSFVPHL